MTLSFSHNIARNDIGVAVVAVTGVSGSAPLDAATEAELAALLGTRKAEPLSEDEEKVRAAARDILRNGVYKPTGRGKPASEYLLGAAREGTFPRVSALVDVNNFISLKYVLPISLWDAGRCASADFEFRLGREGESYVFNNAGQEIDLADLVCGCEVTAAGSRPIVNPIKDSMSTKVQPGTSTVIGAIYFPTQALAPDEIEAAADEFLAKLFNGAAGLGGKLILRPGDKKGTLLDF